ncbi:nucleotide disphospho-sugar-binding domain-containing protein [Kitasatospora sp. NPDC059722]|uniref:nucleotide disphospho-sugar-binding domain-containing protein n=2 Tax=Kitasatospora TaxID=2063 RepID=UPI0036673679
MMRILLTGPAAAGHLFPMVPTAQALRAAGHDILFAVSRPLDQIRSAGFPLAEIGDGRDMRDLFSEANDGQLSYSGHGLDQDGILDMAARAFAYVARPTVDGLLDVASDWGADLLVHAAFQPAAPLVAAKLGIPSVLHNYGIPTGRDMVERLAGHFTDLYEKHGVAGPATPTSLSIGPLGGDPDGLRMRYVPYNGGGLVPGEFLAPAERPRVLITLGTVVTQMDGVSAVSRLIEAASAVDADFLLAVDGADIAPLGTLPGNVRALPWVPLADLVRHCDGVIQHGGAGTTGTTLSAGVPQLLLPQGADNFMVADALVAAGIALRSTSETVDTDVLNRLLTDTDLRAAAARVRAENDALPTPAAMVPTLEALAAAR